MRRLSRAAQVRSFDFLAKTFVFPTFILILLLSLWAGRAYSAQVTLAWDASSGAVAGYKLYYGSSSRDYSSTQDVGNHTSGVVAGLQQGVTYFFAATAYDNSGNESDYSTEVSYQVPGANGAPIAQNGTIATLEDTAKTGKLIATDPEADALTYQIVGSPSKGSVTITNTSTGAYTYTPKANANGTDAFTFRASDGTSFSNTATLTVTITPVNDAPVAVDDTAQTAAGTAVTVNVLANDTDVDGDALTVTSVGQGTNGTVSLLGGKVIYTPKTGFSGQDVFTYTVGDGNGGSDSGKVTVTVQSGNHAPVASNDTLTVLKNNESSGKLSASDVDGDALTYKLVSTPKKGALKITDAATGAFTYTPSKNATGSDTFSFKVSDGQADSNVATVAVTITRRVRIWLEAENGSLSPPVQVAADSQASGGEYAFVPRDAQVVAYAAPPAGHSEYTFRVPVSAKYVIYDRLKSDDLTEKALSISLDNGEYVSWRVTRGVQKKWIWDKATDGSSSEPQAFFLRAGKHSLVVKQQNDGLKIDKILITSEDNYLQEKTYEDAEDGTTDGWDVVDATPAGARIVNVIDPSRQGNVIKLAGAGIQNRYELLSKKYTEWRNAKQFVIEWNLKFSEPYQVWVDVETTAGPKSLRYIPSNKDLLGSGKVVRFGVGSATQDGKWHRFVRDLQADLKKAQHGVVIKKVNSFSVRGSGRVDDIKLRRFF